MMLTAPDTARRALTPSAVHSALDAVCVEMGICLTGRERRRLLATPPHDVDEFAARVLNSAVYAYSRLPSSVRARVRETALAAVDRAPLAGGISPELLGRVLG